MPKAREFNPIAAARRVEDSYREYIATTIHFADAGLQSQLEEILEEPGYLAKGPFLEAAPPYRKDKSVAELVEEGVLCRSMLKLGGGDPEKFDPNRPLYVHQVKAIRKAAAGRNYAVVTGTGSGKTECFLLPILNDILTEFEESGSSAGVRAMILYPMNALANDQLKRLRELLNGTDITFGRYTGDTKETEGPALKQWREENPKEARENGKPENEIISRAEIRRNPPNILLTNYSMLEYLLLRPEDAPLFGGAFGAKWRHVAIDEAHVYSGALGTEIAYLLRRLKARIESETGVLPKLRCYATSATIGSEEDMPKVAVFAQDLFGEPFASEGNDIDVVTSAKDRPQDALDREPWGSLPLSAWGELRTLLADLDNIDWPAVIDLLAASGVPEPVMARMGDLGSLLGLGRILLGEESTAKLVGRCESLFDLTDLAAIGEIGIEGLCSSREGVETLTAMVEVLSAAQRSEGVPILSSRYHSFLRAPEGIFLNLATRKLTPHKTVAEKYDEENDTPVYEVSVCRHCGQAYVLGIERSVEGTPVAWLNPRHEGTDADDEFIPRTYYRLLDTPDDKDPDETIQWLCPVCGSLHEEANGGLHRFSHEQVDRVPVALNKVEDKRADEVEARCRHCGYQSSVAIQAMRVSPEAAGSVVCYDLVREIPPFDKDEEDGEDDWFGDDDDERRAGSVICFSDKRQDAAFFAPSMERTYNNITRRQLIYEAVVEKSKDGQGVKPASVVSWIASTVNRRHPGLLGPEKRDMATAWILDELAAEDSRNSLEGLGVIRIEPTEFNEGLSDPRVKKLVSKMVGQLCDRMLWLTEGDYALFAKVCLDMLRQDNAIEVPEGVDALRSNHVKRGNLVVLGGEGAEKRDTVHFAGDPSTANENKRSAFIRKYAKTVRGADVTRQDAVCLLQSLFTFLTQYLGRFFKGDGYLVGDKGTLQEEFRLSKDVWTLYPHRDDDTVFRCDTCGCESHLDTNGVCTTYKCHGHMEKMTFAEASGKDRFYKEVYQEEALPLSIEEHTAQLSTKKARQVQSDFIRGDVNVLSCTTTFELGVDVGDLRAIFMRNVPPSTANYTQRAGRVGRRAGKPGFAITFARLRPHDIAFFAEPGKIIAGETRVPMCYLDNSAIAIRHVFAVALSEFFRDASRKGKEGYSHEYNEFMDLSSKDPRGLEELREFLDGRPEAVERQLSRVVPEGLEVSAEIGVSDWFWASKLVGRAADEPGRLVMAHSLKHSDYVRVQEGVDRYTGVDDIRAGNLLKYIGSLKKEKTISVLAENGVLPKYGFPTDLVELHLSEIDRSVEENRLQLSRGMRQAIREYAPGSEIVAGKTLWRSTGIKRPRGQELIVRRYGTCPECGAFVWPIENYIATGVCPVCSTEIELENKMLVPSFGFVGESSSKGVGLRKPRAKGYATVHFSQHWPHEAKKEPVSFPGGTVLKRYAGNGHLCVLNAPHSGFQVCDYCCAAASGDETIKHTYRCKESSRTPHISRYNALGTDFVSDVLELVFEIEGGLNASDEDWEATMWAIFAAAAKILEIPETELGGTLYENELHSTSIMIYDNVPGGAGHTRQLSEKIRELIDTAFSIVDGHCGCGDETCCYGCIANYYNQMRQSRLSRGAAKRILGALLGSEGKRKNGEEATSSCEFVSADFDMDDCPSGYRLTALDEGANPDALSFNEACSRAVSGASSEAWASLIRDLISLEGAETLEPPCQDVEMADESGESAFATLVWRSSRIALLDEEAAADFQEVFGNRWRTAENWSFFEAGSCAAEEIVDALRRERG